MSRTVADVVGVVEHAKLEPLDLLPTTQTVYFSPHMGGKPGYLMQVDGGLLDHLERGNSLTMRGNKNDCAVICSDNQCWEVKEAEISNSMLLVPKLQLPQQLQADSERSLQPIEVSGVMYKYLELRARKPHTNELRTLLGGSLYSGAAGEGNGGDLLAWEDLLHKFQASEGELRDALIKINACQIDGYWRLLDFNYELQVLTQILNYIEENSWEINQIQREATISTVSQLEPTHIVEQVFAWYTTHTDTPDLFSLNVHAVCRFHGEVLLRHGARFSLDEFLTVWQQSVPLDLSTTVSQLDGVALVDTSLSPHTISYFPSYSLPEDVMDRFITLFKAKEKWTLHEITPYIQDVTTDKVNVAGLLTKHARCSLHKGVKVYSAKHGK